MKYLILLFALCTAVHAGESKNFTLSNMGEGWFDDWDHKHFSESGSPYVHTFNLEPAFLDRDLFIDYIIKNNGDEFEREIEVELEWALTNRIGLILEAPYVEKEEKGGDRERGLEDWALGLRFLLFSDEASVLSLNLGLGFPTGKDSKGLSADEYTLSTSLSYWRGLSKNITLNVQVGVEQGLETEEREIFYKTALTYTIFEFADDDHSGHGDDHDHHSHFQQGMINLITEFSGVTAYKGGDHTSELLFGVSYLITNSLELRFAYEIPLQRTNELDDSYIFSAVYHF